MKKTIVIVLVLSLVISNFAFASTITLPKESDWYYEAVKYCDENGLIEGVLEGEIKNEPLTRAEFLTIFMRTMEKDPSWVVILDDFKDVAKEAWYARAVYWAVANSVTNGTSWNTFSPDKNITREEAATMIVRFITTNGMTYEKNGEAVVFADKDKVSDWAKDTVVKAAGFGLFKGDEKKNFNPQKHITQPEGLTLFMRLHKDFISGNLSFPVYEPTPEGDITEPKPEPNPEPTTPVGSGKTPVPDQFVTFEGKEYNLSTYEGFMGYIKACSKIAKWGKDYGKLFEEANRIASPGGEITWVPPQKLKATDSIEDNVDKLSVDNLAPIEWLEQTDNRDFRERIAKAIDKARVNAGGGRVIIDDGLMATAQNRAEIHARAGLPLDHSITSSYRGWTPNTPKDRFGSQPGGAEILAYTNVPDANFVTGLWMGSEKHKNTIMRGDITADTYVGVGVARIEGQGYFICAIFSGAPNTFGPYEDPGDI